MNIPYVSLMMLYLIPIGAMLTLNTSKDIREIVKRVKEGDYLAVIERSAAPILSLGIVSFFYLY